jgi:DNA polymerase III epsilon subunit-like protein
MNLVFLDTETTSLRHDRRAWEVAAIVRDETGKEVEHSWFIALGDLELGNADLISLNIGKFYQRHPEAALADNAWENVRGEIEVMADVECITRNAIIVGAVPWFDTEVLANRMRECGLCPSWHYHLVDVEALAAGQLRLPPKWGFDAILAKYGLAYNEADRHTALGDAKLVRDLYDKVMAA